MFLLHVHDIVHVLMLLLHVHDIVCDVIHEIFTMVVFYDCALTILMSTIVLNVIYR